MSDDSQWTCPFPISTYPRITLAHGGGGRLTAQLIEALFQPAFLNPEQECQHDGAVLAVESGRLAFSTDSYVVNPLFFSGGDIGALAVHGTVNDLAMCGARPRWISCGFILEEGLPTETLVRVVRSMQEAARRVGVRIVTGDTKVVERGRCDGLYLNTTGLGEILREPTPHPSRIQAGDCLLVSGDLGRHGIAVLSQRQGLAFESPVTSDVGDLSAPVLDLLSQGVEVRALRDLTRGGLATALVELAEASKQTLMLAESDIEVSESVAGACELLGLDPLYVANEGRCLVVISQAHAEKALSILRSHTISHNARAIGVVERTPVDGRPRVLARNSLGTLRGLERLSGEQLPRIC